MKTTKTANLRIIAAFFVAVMAVISAKASDADSIAVERPVYAAYTIEAGSAHLAQTYLSPLRYSGTGVALAYERMQAMRFDPQRWVMRLDGRLTGACTRNNPARNSNLWDIDLELGWSMARRFAAGAFHFYAGGNTRVDAGMLYLPRNGNNPIAAKASWSIGVSAGAVWHTKVAGKQVFLRYWGEMPLGGIFFSPDYGEPYYEIYLGNRSGLVRGAWPGNFFRLRNLLTADVVLGRTIVRVGYRVNVSSVKAAGIVSRDISHMAVFGLASEWVSLAPGRTPDRFAKIISAMY